MNERIKEFMTDAESTIEFVNGEYCWPPDYIEKLIEIVIKECAVVVENDIDYNDVWCSDKILKHFGVEE